MSRKGPADFAAEVGPQARAIAGMVRRMAVRLTSRAFWQVAGHLLLDNTTETRDAEVFSGIGFYSRPPADGKPEAIVVFPGGASNPVIVALRDEKTRKAVAGGLEPGETAMFNGSAIVVLKANGDIEIRSKDGVAQPLATLTDLTLLRAALDTAVIAIGANGAAAVGVAMDVAYAALPPPFGPHVAWPAGTGKLKAE
jgi:phage gp45-like